MAITVSTWNLHGRARPDLDAVAERLRVIAPDVAAVQEAQHGQALAIDRALCWAFAPRVVHALPNGTVDVKIDASTGDLLTQVTDDDEGEPEDDRPETDEQDRPEGANG